MSAIGEESENADKWSAGGEKIFDFFPQEVQSFAFEGRSSRRCISIQGLAATSGQKLILSMNNTFCRSCRSLDNVSFLISLAFFESL
jgi:hypothetical protein